MSNIVSGLRGIGGKLKLSNIIALAALLLSLPAILLSIDQISEKEKTESEAKQKIEQVEQQIRVAKEQVEQVRLQAEAARLSAAASASSAAELRQQNAFAERSFLIQRYAAYQATRPRIEFVEVNKITFSSSGPSKWVARFSKTGIPPSNVRTWIFSEVKPAGSPIPDLPDCASQDYNNRGSFQNGSIFAEGPQILPGQSKSIASGEQLFIMVGRVCYGDDDGGAHATDFCISARGTNTDWSYGSCGGGNNSYTLQLPTDFRSLVHRAGSR